MADKVIEILKYLEIELHTTEFYPVRPGFVNAHFILRNGLSEVDQIASFWAVFSWAFAGLVDGRGSSVSRSIICLWNERHNMSLEGLPGLAAIESDRPDRMMAIEQARGYRWELRCSGRMLLSRLPGRSQAWSESHRAIPEAVKRSRRSVVVELRVESAQMTEDLPEAVVRMGIDTGASRASVYRAWIRG